METSPRFPELLLQRFQAHDPEGVGEILDRLDERADGWRLILAGMRQYAGHHAPRMGEKVAVVVIDAITDLAPTYGLRPSRRFVDAAVSYLFSISNSAPRIELFATEEEGGGSAVVPVSMLEDALTDRDLASLCGTFEKLRRVVSSREYLHELLLDAVAPEATEDGRLLVQTSATVKQLHLLPWDQGRGIAYRLCEALAVEPILPAPMITDLPEPIPSRSAFRASLETEVPEPFWLYLAHSFQAARYAQLRQKGVRWGLRTWIAEHLFGGDRDLMDREEAELKSEPRAERDEGPDRECEEIGRQIAKGIASASIAVSDLSVRWAKEPGAIDPLFRWITEGTLDALATGNPEPIVMVNAARWGAHLLGGEGAGRIVGRLIERLAARHDKR